MPKLETIIVVRSSDHPGRVFLDTPYDPALIAKIKQYPGAEWRAVERMWLFPVECVELLGEPVRWIADTLPQSILADSCNERLYPFQKAAVGRALAQGAYLVSFEMGLGKTPTAIECLRLQQANNILVVCPAFVRTTWEDEIEKWWPGHPYVTVISTGKVEPVTGINIVSYELLKCALPYQWDALVWDESSNVKNNRAARSKLARQLCLKNQTAFKLCLTATPVDTEVHDLHHQLDCLHPGRWGGFWHFAAAYSIIDRHRYGVQVYGINTERADELAHRLKAVSVRVTKAEVRHLLPAFSIQIIRVKAAGCYLNHRAISELLGSGVRKQHELEAHIEKAGSKKDDTVIELCKAAREAGERNIVVLTHLRSTADRLCRLLSKELDVPALAIDGALNEDERRRRIRDATVAGQIVVATMHSVGIGINELAQYTTMVFAELYWRPLVVTQALGRLNRLSSKVASNVYIPVVEGSLDEPIAAVLKRRLRDAEQLYKPGTSEEALLEGFDKRDEDWSAELQGALTERIEDAYL